MEISFQDFGFYHVDVNYLRYLHEIDSEVQFSAAKDYTQKPFLGILVLIDGYYYFIPLTSAKPKHTKLRNVGPAHYLIYEKIEKTELAKRDIYKEISDTEVLKLFSALEIKKMIPVRPGLFSRIDFSAVKDTRYADLLEKEYRFCQRIQDGILNKAQRIYEEQKRTGIVRPMHCSFAKLEAACDGYKMPDPAGV